MLESRDRSAQVQAVIVDHYVPELEGLFGLCNRVLIAWMSNSSIERLISTFDKEEVNSLSTHVNDMALTEESVWHSTGIGRERRRQMGLPARSVWEILQDRLRRRNRPFSNRQTNFFQRVKSEIAIEDFAARFTTIVPSGPVKAKGRCPLHSEQSASFVIDIVRQRWRCFGGCATGGDLIDLARLLMDRGLL